MLFLLFFMVSHLNFEEIILIDESVMMDDFSISEYQEYYMLVKRKFFGWSSIVIYEDIDCMFISETLFSYNNQSDEEIDYKYEYEQGKDIKSSVAVTGDISTKASGKVKGFNLKFDSKLQSKLSQATRENVSEAWKLDIKVNPYSKVSLKIKGEGKLTNGVSKFYIFWVPVKKGGWEILEVINEYFWLVEEYA